MKNKFAKPLFWGTGSYPRPHHDNFQVTQNHVTNAQNDPQFDPQKREQRACSRTGCGQGVGGGAAHELWGACSRPWGVMGASWGVSWVSSVSPGGVNISKDLPSDWTLVLALPVEHCLEESASPQTGTESVQNTSLAIFPMTFACARWDLIWRSCWRHFGPFLHHRQVPGHK